MCKCTSEIKTPFCGKPGCEMPGQRPNGARHDGDQFDDLAHSLAARDAYSRAEGAKIIAAALRQVAEHTRKRCAEVALNHKPPRLRLRYSTLSAENRAAIDDEARGERIAAEAIAVAILALDLSEVGR